MKEEHNNGDIRQMKMIGEEAVTLLEECNMAGIDLKEQISICVRAAENLEDERKASLFICAKEGAGIYRLMANFYRLQPEQLKNVQGGMDIIYDYDGKCTVLVGEDTISLYKKYQHSHSRM